MIGAPKQQRSSPFVIEDQRSRIAIVVFRRHLEIARLLPAHFACALIKGGDPRFALMQPGEVDVRPVQERRATLIPEKLLLSEALRQIELPTDLPIHCERRKMPTPEIDKQSAAVRHWRRIAARAQRAVLGWTLRPEWRAPQFL